MLTKFCILSYGLLFIYINDTLTIFILTQFPMINDNNFHYRKEFSHVRFFLL